MLKKIMAWTGLTLLLISQPIQAKSKRVRARELGVAVGVMQTGRWNAITDVPGVRVGHRTIIRGETIRTGVTAILPGSGNLYQEKIPAAIEVFNGYGKLAGYTQVRELGNIETPIVLTNTLGVGTAVKALVEFTLRQKGNETVHSVNAVVGETNDGFLNDIRMLPVRESDVLAAIRSALSGPVVEGSVGAGTGTRAFGFKGGIGTSSRITPVIGGKTFSIGVLVQSNFGHQLKILGIPVTRELRQTGTADSEISENGSCMIVVATDAPLSGRNLARMARRAFVGMGRTSDVFYNGSGDYAIAFSTAYRIPHRNPTGRVANPPLMDNSTMTIFFRAVEEATEEAIYNSLFTASPVTGYEGHRVDALPLDLVENLLKKYQMLDLNKRLTWRPHKHD